MNYTQVKKLDEESLKQLVEGKGPADECICNILSPPEEERRKESLGSSLKKGFASFMPWKKKRSGIKEGPKRGTYGSGGRLRTYVGDNYDLPIAVGHGGRGVGGVQATKEVVKRNKPCGKCGCDHEELVLNHSVANIRITTPDVSTFCPCPTHDCFPDKDKLMNNIKVTIEQATVPSVHVAPQPTLEHRQYSIMEPQTVARSLVDAQYDEETSKFSSE